MRTLSAQIEKALGMIFAQKNQSFKKKETIMTKKIWLTLCYLSLGFSAQSFAATHSDKAVKQVETRVEQLRKAMIDANAEQLKELSASALNYGHSGGHVENASVPPFLRTRSISRATTVGRGANMCPNWLRTTSKL